MDDEAPEFQHSLSNAPRLGLRVPAQAGLQLRDARIPEGDLLLETGPGRSVGGGLLSCTNAHRLVGRESLSGGGAAKPTLSDRGLNDSVERDQPRTVWFYRDYVRLTGGHLKHSHYFDHVRRLPGFAPRITFSAEPSNESQARERRRLWPAGEGVMAERWEPAGRDVLFLAGVDWRYVHGSGLETLANPRINLIQHVRHAHEGTELYRYLSERAVRICVSQEVADAISATGRTNGPVLTIPNSIDVTPIEAAEEGSPAEFDGRRRPITIVGYKSPELARMLSERLDAANIEHLLVCEFLDRSAFLALLDESRVAVCLPHEREGFYLPALEAMASGCLVVTLDCIGNRGFCRHDANCLVAEHDPESLFRATKRVLAMAVPERERMHRQALDTAAEHSLEAERSRFHAILGDVDRLWSAAKAVPARGGRRGPLRPRHPVPIDPGSAS